MAHPRRFRFGVQLHNTVSGEDWAATARRVEELGYSTLFVPDHFGEQVAPMPALMAAAAATTTLRVGPLVLDNDYRHPVVTAKEAATIDLLSGGRLELGIGAGWMRTDYDQAGMPYDRAGVRIDRFEEGLRIIKGLLGDGPVTVQGDHYTVTGLEGHPKPVQRPHPPILIGGGGRRVLSIAAREADIVGINPNLAAGEVNADVARDAMADALAEKVSWLRDAAGDRFDDLELNVLTFVAMITDDRQAMAEQLAPAFGVDPAMALESPQIMVGTVDEIVDDLQMRRDTYGISYIVVQEAGFEAMAPVVARLAGA